MIELVTVVSKVRTRSWDWGEQVRWLVHPCLTSTKDVHTLSLQRWRLAGRHLRSTSSNDVVSVYKIGRGGNDGGLVFSKITELDESL